MLAQSVDIISLVWGLLNWYLTTLATAPLESNASDAPENDDEEIILPTEPSEELTADGAEVSAATEENNENDISEPIKEPEFIIDQEAFQELLHSIVNVSNGWSADELCHLRAEMFFSVHKHRMNWDKTELLKVSGKWTLRKVEIVAIAIDDFTFSANVHLHRTSLKSYNNSLLRVLHRFVKEYFAHQKCWKNEHQSL